MFQRLFGKPRFLFYEDSFARTRAGMLAGLRQALEPRIARGENFLLVTHFAETFLELQDKLAAWNIDYQINEGAVRPDSIHQKFRTTQDQVILSLSSLLRHEDLADEAFDGGHKIGVMVTERHPDGVSDNELEHFCRSIPCYVELGYFLSFEDAVVSELVHDSALKILDLFGMGQNELITSNMISRRLQSMLRRNGEHADRQIAADSAEDWLTQQSNLGRSSNKE